ncbi:hypothetical protein O6H91_17G058600 [Diphasiastrum complanatum]|uniref:Uncharacterized protein n=1 Tax=Diphasiastrum complanatum TaxID=34168 RepID=A0ACC2B8B2_DIPCM|nr:hypothetical protein O6H91_17G058600 [Diphasiastrum complanatum]
MEDVDEFLPGLQTQAATRFANGLSFSGATGLGLNPRGFGICTAEQDDRETTRGNGGGLFDLKQIMELVKSSGKFEELSPFHHCFFNKESYDSLNAVGEKQVAGPGARVKETGVNSVQAPDVLEEDFPSTSQGGLSGFPDQLEVSNEDCSSAGVGTPVQFQGSKQDGSKETREVMQDEIFAGVPEECSQFPHENLSATHDELIGADRDISAKPSFQDMEETLLADEDEDEEGQEDGHWASSYSDQNEPKNIGESVQNNCQNSQPEEVCVLDASRLSGDDTRQPNRALKRNLDESVIIINDDDSEDEDEDRSTNSVFYSTEEFDSAVGMSNDSDGDVSSPLITRSDSWNSLDSSSSDDDCLVLERPNSQKGKQPKPKNQDHISTAHANVSRRHAVDDSSDCDVMVGSQDEIRMHWEEAAMRRRLCKPMQSRGSRVGRADSERPCSSSLRKGDKLSGKERFVHSHHQESELPRPTTSQELAESVATSYSSEFSSKKEISSSRGDKRSKPNTVADASEDWLEPDKIKVQRMNPMSCRRGSGSGFVKTQAAKVVDQVMPENIVVDASEDWLELDKIKIQRMNPMACSRGSGSEFIMSQAAKVVDHVMPEHTTAEEDRVNDSAELSDPHAKPEKDRLNHFTESGDRQHFNLLDSKEIKVSDDRHRKPNVVAESSFLAGDRERIKQTVEFKKADEEEWARRQIELERQALEAQRLRKRKRAEADRKLEMENRQKQRLEEIRESQQMEKRNLGLKEQLRGQVRAELERKSLGCIDMASLLRRLGISVDGGAFPTPEQVVNSAYKRALLRFHPDRAVTLALGDPRQQVEAEETFKLMSRMKSSLPPVAGQFFNSRR